jgi:hypothetical protein
MPALTRRTVYPCNERQPQREEPLSALCALGHLRLVPSASEDCKALARVLERARVLTWLHDDHPLPLKLHRSIHRSAKVWTQARTDPSQQQPHRLPFHFAMALCGNQDATNF